MITWLETIGVVFIAVAGVTLGRFISSFRKPWWFLGYLFPCILIAILALARCKNVMYFTEPFSWIAAGRCRFVVISLAVTMGLTVPLSRLPSKLEKILVCILMVIFVTWFSVLPFFAPVLIKKHLSNLKTRFDSDGICRQSTSYTCGPAAAVTALGKLGLTAEEGEIAVLSYTSPIAGTLPVCLSSALQHRYGASGLKCRYRSFKSVKQLKGTGIILAIVRDALLLDHCLAVLEISENKVTVADPVTGVRSMSYEQFEKIWRYSGIVISRDTI